MFDQGDFSEDNTFQLTDWLAHVPKEVLAKNFQVNITAFDHIPSKELYIFPAGMIFFKFQIRIPPKLSRLLNSKPLLPKTLQRRPAPLARHQCRSLTTSLKIKPLPSKVVQSRFSILATSRSQPLLSELLSLLSLEQCVNYMYAFSCCLHRHLANFEIIVAPYSSRMELLSVR